MAERPSYKETLNLPQTEFPMKANLPVREPQILAQWKERKIYQRMVAKHQDKTPFVFLDGPPYSNGDIHTGHVLNKILKDILVKYKNMAGSPTVFIPGWDCHGLPIEQKVLSAPENKNKNLTPKEIRTACRVEAHKWQKIQSEQFRRLGVLADWENPYLTMQKEYEAEEVRILARLFERGLIYRGDKPVYWCIPLKTALAEAEVEYHDHKSPAIYVKFYFDDLATQKKFGITHKKAAVVIWTTTPWTLPANVAISVHPEFDYEFYDSGSEYLLIAQKLIEAVRAEIPLTLKSTGKIFKGSDFENYQVRHPFMERASRLVLGTHVTADAGTGCVHTAPGHGQEDYEVGHRYQLPVLSPVNEAGEFTDEVPLWRGLNVFKANPLIVGFLEKSGHLLAHKEIVHSYAHCWRSKSPLIFRATPQWFMRMDDQKINVRKEALNSLAEIKFVPAWGENRLRAMIESRPDWTLSRQRYWGVPIPIFFCEKCNEPLARPEILNRVATLMESKQGIESYWDESLDQFLKGEKCAHCGGVQFTRGRDILDVWFDSGICHTAVQKKRLGINLPADLYIEGSDQHRGWFQTSLLSAIGAHGKPPFKTLVTHGFILDSQDRKMSKSLGNVIDPKNVIEKSGAEILRLWVAFEDYRQDVNYNQENLNQVTDTYRKFRNIIRFMLGNLFDFDPQIDYQPRQQMLDLDCWILGKLQDLVGEVRKAFENYEFNRIYHALNLFFTVDLSAQYLDIIKDRLYTSKTTGAKRRSTQTALFELLSTLSALMAPILSFLAEETYEYIPGPKEESIFLVDFPQADPTWINPELLTRMDRLIAIRKEVYKMLEELRSKKEIGSGLEAHVKITAQGEDLKALQDYQNYLPELFIVSQVTLSSGPYAPPYTIVTERAKGAKCERCWNYSEHLSDTGFYPGLCPKCIEALS